MTMQTPITNGPWVHGDWVNGRIGGIDESGWCEVWATEKGGGKSLPFVACKHQDMQANAAFIAVAGNVFHETGLTPRQLVEQRDALAAALEGCAQDLRDVTRHFNPHPESVIGKNLAKASAALALVKGATP